MTPQNEASIILHGDLWNGSTISSKISLNKLFKSYPSSSFTFSLKIFDGFFFFSDSLYCIDFLSFWGSRKAANKGIWIEKFNYSLSKSCFPFENPSINVRSAESFCLWSWASFFWPFHLQIITEEVLDLMLLLLHLWPLIMIFERYFLFFFPMAFEIFFLIFFYYWC